MSDLSVQKIVLAGLTPNYAAAEAGGDAFLNSGRVLVHVKNGHTAEQTMTVNSQALCNQGFDHDVAVAIPPSGEKMIGPFPKERFNDVDGKVQISYSGVTNLTIAALELP
jgi:hypothetical protein